MTKESSTRKIYFGAGPAALPYEVLQQVSEAVLDYNNTGLSILEIPHRSKYIDDILAESKALVRELCGLDEDYEVIWLPGGGRLQFSMIPMNFLQPNSTAGYIETGAWAAEAIDYAKHYGNVSVLASSKEDSYKYIPDWPANIANNLSYIHITTNNTIYGTQWTELPQSLVPLIADMSSDIFCMKRDYRKCSMFYAVAQKNIGAAGDTLVVLHKDMLKRVNAGLAPMLDYAAHVKKNSVLNTPPVSAIYTSLLMLRWTKARGIAAIEQENKQKAALLYGEIDRSSVFTGNVHKEHRSLMNVCFAAQTKEQETAFIKLCAENNILGIEGHRSAGAFRVSLYNAIPLSSVEKLVALMQEFEKIQQS
jgi:phosphoserine aminotransferase